MGRLIVLLFLVAIAYGIWRLVRRGREFSLLVRDGVDAAGVVIRKDSFGSGRRRRRNRFLEYRYQDANGGTHVQRSNVSDAVWDAHAEGRPIEIVYSRSDPSVSAPRHLVEAARAAAARKVGGGSVAGRGHDDPGSRSSRDDVDGSGRSGGAG